MELDSLDQADSKVSDEIIDRLEGEIENLLFKEEQYWKIKSQEDWLMWGDRNIELSHSQANHRGYWL